MRSRRAAAALVGLGMAAAWVLLFTLLRSAPVAMAAPGEGTYLSPSAMALSRDGARLYVVAERADALLVVDTSARAVLQRIAVGHVPRGVALSPDGRTAYVTNSWDDTLSVIDLEKEAVARTLATGDEPIDVIADRAGAYLYVANRISNDVSVIEAASGQEVKRLMAGRGASYLTLSGDGSRIYCTHVYPRLAQARTPPESEVTVIDTAKQRVVDHVQLAKTAGVFHVAASADGRLAVAAQMQPKNLIPLAHVEHGWVIGNSLTLFGPAVGAEPVQVPIDELEHYYSLPYGVALTPDGSQLYVTTSGSDSVTAIDVKRLLGYIGKAHQPFNNDLSAAARYVQARIAVGRNPRGAVLSKDGRRLYVANRLDDTLSVIDTAANRVSATIDLGASHAITAERHGEQIFHSSRYAFQGQMGCANCHIDSTFDGLTWDLEPDGFGKDIVDNRLIEDVKDTAPYKWNGGNPDLATECGPRTEKYFWRSQNYSDADLADLVFYIRGLPARPNRLRRRGQTEAQARGKAIFLRHFAKHGVAIPIGNRCASCHSGPKYTNRMAMDVGTGTPQDRSSVFDVPQLTNVALTAPYLHNGEARTLEEIWTVFNPEDRHGVTNDLTKDELNDLIEYLRTL